MLTQEQIKNLKEGDPLIVNVSMKRIDKDGDIWITVPGCAARWFPPDSVSLPSERGTSVPTPKYDPTLLFREGDKVRVVEWNGRHFHDRDHGTELTTGCICEVDDDEEAASEHGVLVVYEEQVRCIAPCFLELVTPVEELEPYYVVEYEENIQIRRNPNGIELARYDRERHPNAKAAAEAERDRLNAEYRKEHGND